MRRRLIFIEAAAPTPRERTVRKNSGIEYTRVESIRNEGSRSPIEHKGPVKDVREGEILATARNAERSIGGTEPKISSLGLRWREATTSRQ